MPDNISKREYAALKRARRLLRICDVAVTQHGADRQRYLERACCDDPDLLAEAIKLLEAVDQSKEFLLDFSQFRSIPPRNV
ncbi:MAG: hypothetical protein AAFO81_07065 [Pseudomonadota bacterium]